MSRRFIDEAFAARRQGADTDHIFILTAVMDDECFMIGNFLAVFRYQLFMRRRTMHPRSNQYRNGDIRIPLPQFSQQLRHDNMARDGSRMVAGYDRARLFAFGQLA